MMGRASRLVDGKSDRAQGIETHRGSDADTLLAACQLRLANNQHAEPVSMFDGVTQEGELQLCFANIFCTSRLFGTRSQEHGINRNMF